MSYTLTRVHPPDTDTLLLTAQTDLDRLTAADRLQLRLGLWLLLRSARHRDAARDHDAHTLRREQAAARAEREHRALRAFALGGVRS